MKTAIVLSLAALLAAPAYAAAPADIAMPMPGTIATSAPLNFHGRASFCDDLNRALKSWSLEHLDVAFAPISRPGVL